MRKTNVKKLYPSTLGSINTLSFAHFKYENNLQVYYGILKHDVNLIEEKNRLEWVTINEELLDNSKFAGNYNIPHIIRQIQIY